MGKPNKNSSYKAFVHVWDSSCPSLPGPLLGLSISQGVRCLWPLKQLSSFIPLPTLLTEALSREGPNLCPLFYSILLWGFQLQLFCSPQSCLPSSDLTPKECGGLHSDDSQMLSLIFSLHPYLFFLLHAVIISFCHLHAYLTQTWGHQP